MTLFIWTIVLQCMASALYGIWGVSRRMKMLPARPVRQSIALRPIPAISEVTSQSIVPPAFWERAAWLNDSRDHPSNPQFEPFWMRPLAPIAEPLVDVVKRNTTDRSLEADLLAVRSGFKSMLDVVPQYQSDEFFYNCPTCGMLGVPQSSMGLTYLCRVGHRWDHRDGRVIPSTDQRIPRKQWKKRLSERWDNEEAPPAPPPIDYLEHTVLNGPTVFINKPGQHVEVVTPNKLYRLADLPRPACPKCGRSHPTCEKAVSSDGQSWDEENSFNRCTKCRHTWFVRSYAYQIDNDNWILR